MAPPLSLASPVFAARTVPAPYTESRVRTLEQTVATLDADLLAANRRAGELQQQLDDELAKVRRMGRMLDEHHSRWRDEDRRRVTGGTAAEWQAVQA